MDERTRLLSEKAKLKEKLQDAEADIESLKLEIRPAIRHVCIIIIADVCTAEENLSSIISLVVGVSWSDVLKNLDIEYNVHWMKNMSCNKKLNC